ncbi:MAG: maleylacetate reductase [Pseudomonadota bacterium]
MLQRHDIARDGAARFGAGLRHHVAEAVAELGARRALVLSTPRQSDLALDVATVLGPLAAGVFSRAVMHTPVEVTQDALDHARELRADCVVAIGGGSTIGLGKALAYHAGFAQVAIPTTYAGSEATPILGQTESGEKTTLSDPRVLPGRVLYDPELIVALPVEISVTSGLNAMAHAAEALYAPDRTAATDAAALAAFQAFAQGLPQVVQDPADLHARGATQRGAWGAGRVLGQVGMALHHKLCHVLGGSFGLPHAQTHAVILPHAIAYNAQSAAVALRPLAHALGGDAPGAALYDFARSLGAPTALRDVGLREADLPRAAALATARPYPNPHPITEAGLLTLLRAAWAGEAPAF